MDRKRDADLGQAEGKRIRGVSRQYQTIIRGREALKGDDGGLPGRQRKGEGGRDSIETYLDIIACVARFRRSKPPAPAAAVEPWVVSAAEPDILLAASRSKCQAMAIVFQSRPRWYDQVLIGRCFFGLHVQMTSVGLGR